MLEKMREKSRSGVPPGGSTYFKWGGQWTKFLFFKKYFFGCFIDRALLYITIYRAGSGYVDRNVVVSNSGPTGVLKVRCVDRHFSSSDFRLSIWAI
jgi:hypothetical protein